MSTRKQKSLSLSPSPLLSNFVSSSPRSNNRSRRRRTVRNTIIQIAKVSKDKHVIGRLAQLAKHYKKENLVKMESILKSAFPNTRITSTNSITSEDKDQFIDFCPDLHQVIRRLANKH